MAEPRESEFDAVGRIGVRQGEEVQAHGDHGDRQQRDDLDGHTSAGKGDEHRQRRQHGGESVEARRLDHKRGQTAKFVVPLARLERALPEKLDF